jgi:hypothetical protein
VILQLRLKGSEAPICATSLQWLKAVVANRDRYCFDSLGKAILGVLSILPKSLPAFIIRVLVAFGDVPNIDTKICRFLPDLWYLCSRGGYCGTTVESHMLSEVKIDGV